MLTTRGRNLQWVRSFCTEPTRVRTDRESSCSFLKTKELSFVSVQILLKSTYVSSTSSAACVIPVPVPVSVFCCWRTPVSCCCVCQHGSSHFMNNEWMFYRKQHRVIRYYIKTNWSDVILLGKFTFYNFDNLQLFVLVWGRFWLCYCVQSNAVELQSCYAAKREHFYAFHDVKGEQYVHFIYLFDAVKNAIHLISWWLKTVNLQFMV